MASIKTTGDKVQPGINTPQDGGAVGERTKSYRTKGKQQKQSFRRVICLIHKAVKTTGEKKGGEDKRGEMERSLKEG